MKKNKIVIRDPSKRKIKNPVFVLHPGMMLYIYDKKTVEQAIKEGLLPKNVITVPYQLLKNLLSDPTFSEASNNFQSPISLGPLALEQGKPPVTVVISGRTFNVTELEHYYGMLNLRNQPFTDPFNRQVIGPGQVIVDQLAQHILTKRTKDLEKLKPNEVVELLNTFKQYKPQAYRIRPEINSRIVRWLNNPKVVRSIKTGLNTMILWHAVSQLLTYDASALYFAKALSNLLLTPALIRFVNSRDMSPQNASYIGHFFLKNHRLRFYLVFMHIKDALETIPGFGNLLPSMVVGFLKADKLTELANRFFKTLHREIRQRQYKNILTRMLTIGFGLYSYYQLQFGNVSQLLGPHRGTLALNSIARVGHVIPACLQGNQIANEIINQSFKKPSVGGLFCFTAAFAAAAYRYQLTGDALSSALFGLMVYFQLSLFKLFYATTNTKKPKENIERNLVITEESLEQGKFSVESSFS